MDNQCNWHSLEKSAVIGKLDSQRNGLTTAEAQRRLKLYGHNLLPAARLSPFYRFFLRQFVSPFIYVLIFAMLISLLVGNLADAAFIGVILVANATIGALQEHHAQRSAEALHKLLVTQAKVNRDNQLQNIAADQLVPGDSVILSSGTRVPADIRLLDADDLQIDESLLTGESLSVDKDAEAILDPLTVVAERKNQAFASTLVTSGRGRGLVVSTGINSEVGKLASQLSRGKLAPPPLLQRIKIFSQRLTLILLLVIILLATVELLRGTELILVFMTVTALAVAAIPEGLHVGLTIVLSIAMRRMAKQHVVVRKLVATESLGSCTLIATDKTGTLTLNQLTATQVRFVDGPGFQINTSGFSPIPKQPLSIAESEANQQRLRRLCLIAGLCNEANIHSNSSTEWRDSGDSVDRALLTMAFNIIGKQSLATYTPLEHIHYEPHLGFAATLHVEKTTEANIDSGKTAHIKKVFVKGAVEKLLPMCNSMAGLDQDRPLEQTTVNRVLQKLACQGVRILAFADGNWVGDKPFKTEHLRELCLVGLVGMADPLRPEAAGAIAECKAAGIKICMLTGDHPLTAISIARQLKLISDKDNQESQLITGSRLAEATAVGIDAVDKLTANGLIYARVTPEQKLGIVESLIRQGEFVAVTGDGVNDAPALNASHVGVAMGLRGTDIAREASDLLLTDDNFASVVAGVREGRIAYQNIRKVVFFLISTGAAEIVLFLLASIFATPMPLTAVQLLWLNLVTSGVQHIGLAIEPGEGDEMQKPPRPPDETLFNPLMIRRVLISALVVGGLSFACFAYLLDAGWTETSARNSVLLLMVLFENVQVLNSRSESTSALLQPWRHNPSLILAILAAQAIHIAAMYWPFMQQVLGAERVQLSHWASLLLIALSLLMVIELDKVLWRRKREKML